MSNPSNPREPSSQTSTQWELFLGMWERANLVRSFFWSHRSEDLKILLTHFLARLRRYYGADFCLAVLQVNDENLLEVGVPESGAASLPAGFSQRCLESLANSRAPVTWKEAGAGLGFRTTVVAPLRSPTDASFGFLLLGHVRSRGYTAIELFLLQELAGELSWVVRDVAARNALKDKVGAAARAMKESLQVIIGNVSLLRENPGENRAAGSSEWNSHLESIEAAVQKILLHMRELPEGQAEHRISESAAVPRVSDMIQSLAPSRQRAKERGIQVEVVCAPDADPEDFVVSDRLNLFLSALVDQAALTTRNETVRVTVKPVAGELELMVRGTQSNRVADGLKALFDNAARWEGAREGREDDWVRVREYLEDSGGDAYLKSHPGEAAEFVVRLPIEGSAQPGRLG